MLSLALKCLIVFVLIISFGVQSHDFIWNSENERQQWRIEWKVVSRERRARKSRWMEHEVKTPKAVSERKGESARGGGITHTTSHLPFPLCLTHSLSAALLRLAQFADHILSSIINACPFVCLFVCLPLLHGGQYGTVGNSHHLPCGSAPAISDNTNNTRAERKGQRRGRG